MDAMEKLNDLVDESDPDAGFWNIITYKILYTLFYAIFIFIFKIFQIFTTHTKQLKESAKNIQIATGCNSPGFYMTSEK